MSPSPAPRPDPVRCLDAIDADASPPGHDLLGAIDEAIVVHTGYEFFRELVRRLAEAFDVRFAFAARFDGDDYDTMRIVTFHDRATGEFRDDYPFPVAGTPCVHVLDGRLIALSSGVCDSFPAERRRGVQSYIAIPLIEPGGRVAGHLVAADTRDREWGPDDERTMRLFARRATAEILRHQYERALREARDAAERASRARADALEWLTHELRTPLHGILGHAELLGRRDLDDEAAASVDAIRQSGERLRTLVGESLALASIGAGSAALEAKPLDVAELLEHTRRVLDLRARASGCGIAWRARVLPDCRAVGDVRRLQQLFSGALRRLLDANPGGALTVEANVEAAGTAWTISLVAVANGSPAWETTQLFAALVGAEFHVGRVAEGIQLRLIVTLPGVRPARTEAASPGAAPSVEVLPAALRGALLDAARSGDVAALEALLGDVTREGAIALASELQDIARTFDMAALAQRIERIGAR